MSEQAEVEAEAPLEEPAPAPITTPEPDPVTPASADPPIAPFLSGAELVRRLAAAKDEGVIEEVCSRAEKQLAAEDAHAAKLDARATALFAAAGFSMTVAFSFGGWALLDNARKVPSGQLIAVAFVFVLALGVATSAFALRALLLTFGQKFPDERDIFRPEALTKTKTQYKKYIAVHLWLVWQDRFERNERRAGLIRTGQFLFVGFLAAIFLLSILTTTSAISRSPDPAPPKSGNP
ncbi:MAG: hypothetical protein IPM35_33375 [Myxococcales bacterium]|nr:hypothetical protein [Myxococcales bacterium]